MTRSGSGPYPRPPGTSHADIRHHRAGPDLRPLISQGTLARLGHRGCWLFPVIPGGVHRYHPRLSIGLHRGSVGQELATPRQLLLSEAQCRVEQAIQIILGLL